MMRFFLLVTILILSLKIVAQLPSVYIKPKHIIQFATETKEATLYIVIDNEKNNDDAAVIDAAKNYWKQGNVKYLSTLQFTEKLKSKNFDIKDFYLFQNFKTNYQTRYFLYQANGYYLTNKPYELLYSAKPKNYPVYLFFSANNLSDSKGDINKGYYSLMIKNFNYDISYCRNADNFKTKPKYKRVKGLAFLKEMSAFSKKTFLLVKEQIPKKEKNVKKSKKDTKESVLKNTSLDIKENVLGTEVKSYVVFPEDVEFAIKKGDKDVLLYSGGTVYSAEDGSAYATYKTSPTPSTFYIIYSITSLVLTVAVFAIVLGGR